MPGFPATLRWALGERWLWSGREQLGGGDYEVLSSDDGEDQDGPSRRRLTRGRIVVGAAAASVLAIAGGAYVAYGALSGGGAQPETVVPAAAAAYAEVDLDPAASQKVAAFRFLHRFPLSPSSSRARAASGPISWRPAFRTRRTSTSPMTSSRGSGVAQRSRSCPTSAATRRTRSPSRSATRMQRSACFPG